MDLNTVWFVLIAVLFTGYFVLEGFDFGVGILLPFLGRTDGDRQVIVNSVGPHWDANEAWILTAGGAMLAVFPEWSATLLSGFSLALLLILAALILRGTGFQLRSKRASEGWRRACDTAIFVGSAVPALLWGVALTNVVQGVPIDANGQFAGSLLTLLNVHALLGGLVSLLVFTLYAAAFLAMRTEGAMQLRARDTASRLWWPTALVTAAFAAGGYIQTDILHRYGLVPGTLPFIAMALFVASYVLMRLGLHGWAFVATALTILIGSAVAFEGLFPRVLPSTLDPRWDLTIYSAASSPLTLKVMLSVAVLLLPGVLASQTWSYRVFRQRVTPDSLGAH